MSDGALVIVSSAYGSQGDVVPLLALAREVRSQGTRVAFITHPFLREIPHEGDVVRRARGGGGRGRDERPRVVFFLEKFPWNQNSIDRFSAAFARGTTRNRFSFPGILAPRRRPPRRRASKRVSTNPRRCGR